MDKLKMHSPDLSQENIAKIRALFPGCVTEARDDKTGTLRLAVDFDQLKQELSDHIVEGPQERYRLDWPGKREALLTANAPIAKTLRPMGKDKDFLDKTKNLFVEGDNLDALKLLQEIYLGRVKMIYIDPPYNTGSDFIYADDFSEDFSEFLIRSNQVDAVNNKLVANPETEGRFHSDWLSMMYARLKVARNLLSDDGVIFISIDERESANLRKVCDDVFGESNLESQVAWRRRHNQPNDKSKMIAKVSEVILVYAKDSECLKARGTYYGLPLSADRVSDYANPDNDPNGAWSTNPWKAAVGRGGTRYKITTPTNRVLDEVWYGNEDTFKELLESGRVYWTSGGDGFPRIKIYLKDAMMSGQAGINFFTHDRFGSNQEGSSELQSLFGASGIFDNPKPTRLLKALIKMATSGDSIVLDFFAGSGSLADAVIQLNAEEGTSRRFFCVQLAEEIDSKSPAFKAGFKRISDVSQERIRRAGKKALEGECHPNWNRDVGFRALKVDTSNMKDVYYRPDQLSQADLFESVDNVKPDRTAEDLLFQVLVDWGVDLTLPIRRETLQGKTVFFVDDNALVACFDQGISEELVKELAKAEPLRVVFRDNGFASDALKINVEQIFRQLSPSTELKTL